MKRIAFLMAGLTAIVAVAVVLTLIIVNALRTPVNGPVRHYDALFTDASGLIVGNDVRISGVQVGKVEKIHLDGKNARITFNVLTDHPLYQNTTVAIRYQSLVGQRYVEIAQAPTPSAPLAAGTTIPLGQTIPSFDIAKLFNGFRPIFETLDPAQFNRLTENILQLIQGDERGIGPILRDIDAVLKLSVDRQAALQTIITNLGDISKDLGGTSDQLFYLINDLNDVLEPFEKQADEFNRAGADALPVLRRSVSLLRYIENSGRRRTAAAVRRSKPHHPGNPDHHGRAIADPRPCAGHARCAHRGENRTAHRLRVQERRGQDAGHRRGLLRQSGSGGVQVKSLKSMFARNRPILDEHEAAKRNRRNGLIGVLVIAAVLAATGVAFVNTSGMKTYALHLRASGGLRAGDDVRIAGISVGKVSTVRIDKSLVEATFTVDHAVPVGSESRADIRMLTPLGGHYLALYPEGSTPLGKTPIPPERTSIPFEINELFQKFTPVVKKVDAKVIHDSLMEVANAVDKYPNGLRDFFQSSQSLIKALEPTTEDFHATLNYANEYLRAFKTGKEQLASIVTMMSKLGAKYSKSTTDLIEVFVLLRDLARIFDRFFKAYARDYEPMLNGLDDIVDTLTKYPEKLGKAAEQWGQLVGIVLPMLSGNGITINENDRVIPGQDVCLPHFFRFC